MSARRPSAIGTSKRSRRNVARPRSSSTAVTRGPGVEQPAGQEPETGADLEDASIRLRVRPPRGSREDVRVGQEVLRQGVAGAQAGGAQRGADVGRVDRHRVASGQRRPRIQVERRQRTPAMNRRAPAAPIIAPLSVHRPGRGTISGTPRAGRLVPESLAQHRVGRHAAAEHDRARPDLARRPGRSCVTSTSTTASWKPQASSAVVAARQGRVGVVGREALVGPGLGDDPSGGGLEAREREVVRVAHPGPREDDVAPHRRPRPPPGSPARPGSRGPAAGRPCRTPRPAASSTVVPSNRYVRWSRISAMNVWPPDTTSATSGKTGSGLAASSSPGSSSQAAYTWPSR